MKFSIKNFSVNVTKSADLVTFTERIFDGKLHFLGSVRVIIRNVKNPSPSYTAVKKKYMRGKEYHDKRHV